MRGSDHNDLFVGAGHGLLDCKTNHAGGTLGGISTGLPLIMRMGIKPASSISRDQETALSMGTNTSCRSRAATTHACSLGVHPLWRVWGPLRLLTRACGSVRGRVVDCTPSASIRRSARRKLPGPVALEQPTTVLEIVAMRLELQCSSLYRYA